MTIEAGFPCWVPSYSHGPGDPELSLEVSLFLHARPKRNRVPFEERNLSAKERNNTGSKQGIAGLLQSKNGVRQERSGLFFTGVPRHA